MPVYSNSALIPQVLPGLAHRTLAGPEHGLKGLEIWSQSLDALTATPLHRHDCEEVLVVVAGKGNVAISGSTMNFSVGDTVIIPRYEVHQIVNGGESALRLLSALNMAPVRTESPDGFRIDLPWQRITPSREKAWPDEAPVTTTRHITPSRRWAIQAWLLQCFLAAFGRQATQRQRLALFELEEDQLRDIGLSKQDALDEAHKPFWR